MNCSSLNQLTKTLTNLHRWMNILNCLHHFILPCLVFVVIGNTSIAQHSLHLVQSGGILYKDDTWVKRPHPLIRLTAEVLVWFHFVTPWSVEWNED